MSILEILNWFMENWLIIIWFACIVIGYIYAGKTGALAVFTFGLAFLSYKKGREHQVEKAKQINKDRQDAYDKIEKRNTTSDDVIDRMRKSRY